MKQRLLPVILAISLIGLIILGCVGMFLMKQYIPSKEIADKQQLLNVEGDQVAIFLNNSLQNVNGIFQYDQPYLPISWVNANINERFYWDEVEKMLVYTLPESIVYADKRTVGASGKPLLISLEDDVYLSLSLILTYTNTQADIFDSQGLKWIYLDTTWTDRQYATVVSDDCSRVSDGIQYAIVSDLKAEDSVQVLDTDEEWARIICPDGFIGYIDNKSLSPANQVAQISSFKEPIYQNISLDRKVNLAFHQVLSLEANDNLERLVSNTTGLNVIAPTWFFLIDNNGNYESLASKKYVNQAHDLGLQVWGVLDNFNRGEDVNSELLFAKTSTRQKLIKNLMKDVIDTGIDGINLDVEGIKAEAGPHYVQFIRELSVACRKQQIVLSIDNYAPSPSTVFYNRAEQGRVADYVIVMGYDEHYSGGDAGSVASLGFVRKGIEETLAQVPKEKLINAVPFYTRIWIDEGEKTRAEAFGMVQAQKWIDDNQVELYWQPELGQYYGELMTDEGKKYVWMEDKKSLQLKVDLIKEYDLAGVASWKLGFEPATIWKIMNVNN